MRKRFENLNYVRRPNLFKVIRWGLTRKFPNWPRWVEIPQSEKPFAEVANKDLRVTFINHATTLLQLERFNILTDPVYSDYIGPFSLGTPKRIKKPGIAFSDLPEIHVVLLSHNHYDHMDLATLRLIAKNHPAKFVTPLGNARYLRSAGINDAIEMDWWQSLKLSAELELHCVPAQHWSIRRVLDENKSLWSGYVLKGNHCGNVYFAGDTGMGPHFAEIQKKFPSIRLSLLPIGAYLPRWFMKNQHMSPEDAVHAHEILQSKTSVAIHFGTFPLADENYDEPIIDLQKALQQKGIPLDDFWALAEGEGRNVAL